MRTEKTEMAKANERGVLRKTKNIVYVCFMACMMASCVPVSTTYYRPYALDGRVVAAHCPPVKSFILFEKEGVILGSKVSRTRDGLINVIITFEVPKDRTAVLMQEEVFSMKESQVFARAKLHGRVWVSAGRTEEFPVTMPMLGKTDDNTFFKQITLYGTTQHAYYFFTAQLLVPDHDAFTLKIPDFSVNGVEVHSPSISYSQEVIEYLGPLNC